MFAAYVCMPFLPCMICYLRGKAREDNQINGSDNLEGKHLTKFLGSLL